MLRISVWALFGVGCGLAALATLDIDIFRLWGLRQTWDWFLARPYQEQRLRSTRLFNWIRHPIYLGLLIVFWVAPTMTLGHAILAFGLTVYLLIGLHYEERDLEKAFGEEYRQFRKRVPALFPRPWRFGRN